MNQLATVVTAIGLALSVALPALAAIDTVRVDLNPLIDSAAHSKEQFAVNIPRSVSSLTQGTWSRQGAVSTWVYTTQIPTAVSLSFHAAASLPSSSVLTVSTERSRFQYTARDVAHSGLWSRPLAGDTITLSLRVNSNEAKLVRFQIESLQAGYRGLGGGVADHPRYALLKKALASAASCTENYECHITADNQGPAHSTVALIIGNLYQCTGTLINNTAGDGAPYVLTARHCEKGELGGGDPNAAELVSVIWDAVSPCGTMLGSLYSNASVSQFGAVTAFEQQDLWLLRLSAPPVASDAYFSGWDASGNDFAGGYTIHHALGSDQQYVQWSGNSALERIPGTTLGIAYDSTFWGVVNSLGNIGAGGSGSALFTPDNLVAGSASLAQLPGGADTGGVCPASTPPAPSPNTAIALFTTLSGAWTSTADHTSSTHSTLKSLLDPAATGALTQLGLATQPLTVTASTTSANSGDLVTLSWNVPGAGSCAAGGGSSGDGWAGSQPASGSVQLTSTSGGNIVYALNCRVGNQLAAGSATISWNFVPPYVSLTGSSQGPLTLETSTSMSWQSNVEPCVASGGMSGDGWAGPQPSPGSFNLTVSHTGFYLYSLSCGTGARSATSTVAVDGVDPYITLVTSASTIAAGSRVYLNWFGYGTGAPCTPSGGSPSDNWAMSDPFMVQNGSNSFAEPNPGTFTFTITCTIGGKTVSSSKTVIVTADAPAASLTVATATKQTYQPFQSVTGFDLLWSSNWDDCTLGWTDNQHQSQVNILFGEGTSGALYDYENQPGVVTYHLVCGVKSATATINWVTEATPAPVLTSTDTEWAAGIPYAVSWNSPTGSCVASGGTATDGWAGSKSPTGTTMLTETQPGAHLFTLVCGAGANAATSNLIILVHPPRIQMYSTPGTSPSTGLPFTSIIWSSSVGPCQYVDGSAPNAAATSVSPVGSATPSPAVAGIYLFTLACGTGSNAIYAATIASVPVSAPTTLTASATQVPVNSAVTLTWSSANGICYASGGDGTAPWIGTLGGAGSGSLIVTSKAVAAVDYSVTCNGETAHVTVNYLAVPATSATAATPDVTLSTNVSSQAVGQSISVTWSSQNADSCTASGGTAGDGWTGDLAASGSMAVTEQSAGTVTFTITCAGAPPAATASEAVVISSSGPSSSTGSGSSHSGGGTLDLGLLLLLGAPTGRKLVRTLMRRRSLTAES